MWANNFRHNEQGEKPVMRNYLFINKREDEMEQPVLNLKNAKLSKPRLLVIQHVIIIGHFGLNGALNCWRSDVQEALLLL